ncbi:coiled-coil domain-containing protein 124 [Adelges cooleyi]|uniref:coiled-coil domain-containing protein 124 n=1 Tax=Adelges cooleyi TaxID=133065 RepID=UPI00217FC512|nr:coiled-coil domain-containing protein 124 [Adelges cooleyi]XP_050424060.1 coiled-coil domain-containing protein 124 [Adelges cooleyi]
MPKKFVGMNSKAMEAKARKDALKQEADANRKKAIEDELWKDDDKNVARKLKRKEEKEKKKIDHMEKKREAQLILEAELQDIKTKQENQKVTRHQLMKELEKPSSPKSIDTDEYETPIEENLNRLSMHDEEARTVDEALHMLNPTQKFLDKHPEKRLKAAYTAFEAENLPRLRAENPSMRLSQVKQLLNREWMKSPTNPINQKYINQ